MSVVEFGEPPVSQRRQRSQRWVDVAAQLQAKPGEWAKIEGDFSPGVATHIKKGNYKHFLVGIPETMTSEEWMRAHWEIRTHKVGEARRDEIWMRYLP